MKSRVKYTTVRYKGKSLRFGTIEHNVARIESPEGIFPDSLDDAYEVAKDQFGVSLVRIASKGKALMVTIRSKKLRSTGKTFHQLMRHICRRIIAKIIGVSFRSSPGSLPSSSKASKSPGTVKKPPAMSPRHAPLPSTT